MTLETFRELAREYQLIPVTREVLFDTNTAVTAYAKIRDGKFSFLLESVIGGEKWGRYTFLGSAPREVLRAQHGGITRWTAQHGWQNVAAADPLAYLQQRLAAQRVAPVPGLPRFLGGAVGYLAYDVVRFIERLPNAPPDDLELPDALLLFTDTVIAIDNVFGKAIIICMAEVTGGATIEQTFQQAQSKLADVAARLAQPHTLDLLTEPALPAEPRRTFRSSFARADFESAVERIRAYIKAGDAFQVVLSQRLEVPLKAAALDAYRILRSLNPSPYLYLLELDGLTLVGSSPEALVRVEDGRVVVKPIAGTRRRGASEAEDIALAAELVADEKERAEHLMLVDLARNDVGRVAAYGSVRVGELMKIERYSHVLHMVTQVEAELRPGLVAMDVLRACFPAGTVSGAPKVRAMELIDDLEPVRRGPYAGAVGYFSYGGHNMDMAIAIRTLMLTGGKAFIQAGAGIVLDSIPSREYEETLSKADALLQLISILD